MTPDEPNQKMDELLKACAEERRAQNTAPMELHPVSRNQLLAEVKRQFPTPGSLSSRAALGPRRNWLRWLIPAFAIFIAVGGAVFWMAWSNRRAMEEEMAFASPLDSKQLARDKAAVQDKKEETKSLAMAEPPSVPRKVEKAPAKPLTEETKKTQTAVLESSTTVVPREQVETPALAANSVPEGRALADRPAAREAKDLSAAAAPPPPQSAAPATVPAPTRSTTSVKPDVALRTETQARSDSRPSRSTTPSGSAAEVRARAATEPAPVAKNYSQKVRLRDSSVLTKKAAPADAPATEADVMKSQDFGKFQNSLVSQSSTANVLSVFQVQQVEDAIKIIDSDGSVYRGLLKPGGTSAGNRTSPAGETIYDFDATGMNKTLKENVTVKGQMFIQPEAGNPTTKSIPSNSKRKVALTNEVLPEAETTANQIQGRATIGQRQEVPLNALPLKK